MHKSDVNTTISSFLGVFSSSFHTQLNCLPLNHPLSYFGAFLRHLPRHFLSVTYLRKFTCKSDTYSPTSSSLNIFVHSIRRTLSYMCFNSAIFCPRYSPSFFCISSEVSQFLLNPQWVIHKHTHPLSTMMPQTAKTLPKFNH